MRYREHVFENIYTGITEPVCGIKKMGFRFRRPVKGRGKPPAFLFLEAAGMSELSVFVDESGDLGTDSTYYMLTLVFHDQGSDISSLISDYERVIRERELPDYPLHFVMLTHGNDCYGGMDVRDRIRMLRSFATFAWRIPFTYHTFTYEKR